MTVPHKTRGARASAPDIAAAPRVRPASLELPPYETVALVLQGGGALGAYQAGVYQGLDEAGITPNWIAGISIGALNAAVIAGNAPAQRVARLLEFWETICRPAGGLPLPGSVENWLFNLPDPARAALASWQATSALTSGQHGFFTPRFPPPLPILAANPASVSYYDTGHLKSTLERLCDFDRINSKEMRVSVGAVNVGTGNFAYFDNTKTCLRAEHFMASGALPPGFPAVEIDGEYYWDGGLLSNTPLTEVLRPDEPRDSLVFQVDLWKARGEVPRNMAEVAGRAKDIQYSSRTRLVTDSVREMQQFRSVLREVLEEVPDKVRKNAAWSKIAERLSCSKRYNVVHLIYQNQAYESHYKDYQFGLTTMQNHWQAGVHDMRSTLQHPHWFDMPDNQSGFVTHDLHQK